MNRSRGFEFISGYKESGFGLPTRKTTGSAGYDIAAIENICLTKGMRALIPTGIKAYMQSGEVLVIHVRSGLAVKHGLYLANGQGIIDSDYYNNPDNEGHIMIALVNGGEADFLVEKGMRIAQGIFYNYLTVDQDGLSNKVERLGGIGSTGSF